MHKSNRSGGLIITVNRMIAFGPKTFLTSKQS
jgi:hypothetical protein